MQDIISIEDVRQRARRRLPRFVFDFVDGAAEDEVTLRANRRGFEEVTFSPRVLVNVSNRDLRTTVLGEPVSLPVLLAPAGANRLAWRDGELAAARAAGREGTIFALSTGSSYSIEEVAAVATGPLWFQLYPWRSREVMASLVERAQKAGYRALCITVDVPIGGKRERDLRNRVTLPPSVTWRQVWDVLPRPAWLLDFLLGPPIVLKNLVGQEFVQGKRSEALWGYVDRELINPAVSWEDLAWLRQRWTGPLIIKGIMTAEDARRALDYGVNGIVVSNHGGRQLDGLPASIRVLPEIVEAVTGRAEVFIDGGVRRGADVVKAIALGARACLIGRPYVFGLAAGGEAGVVRVLQIFRNEIDRTLALLGRRTLAELDRSAVRLPR